MTAEDATRLLLAFYLDVRPGPRVQRFAEPGEVPSRAVVCPDCDGEGMVVRKWKIGCQRCGGSLPNFNAQPPNYGRPGRGYIVVDDYTDAEVGTVETGTVVETRTVMCDACGGAGCHGNTRVCRYCHGAGSVQVSASLREPDTRPSKRDRDRDNQREALRAGRASGSAGVWTSGSFSALERALRELRPPLRRKALLCYALGDVPEDADTRRALSYLARRIRAVDGKVSIPADIRKWHEARSGPNPSPMRTRGERNSAMREARAQGKSLAEVARLFGVSKATAGRVCG